MTVRHVGEGQLDDLAVGAAVLGTGGGGNPYLGALLTKQVIREHRPVELVTVDEVPDDALVVATAGMGAPTVGIEKLPRGDEHVRALQALQSYLGRPITHTVSIEAGGSNSTVPLRVGATLRIPVVDADGMGRAFPEIQMVTATLYGVSATPMALADEKGNTAIIDTVDNHWSEQLGRLIRQTRAAHGDPIAAILRRLGGYRLFDGKISDVGRRTETGFAKGEARIAGTGPDTGSALAIRFQNEHLVAVRDGQVAASVPDLIIVLDAETGGPITTEELRYGLRVTVIAAPCDFRWRTSQGLALVGPRAFGYDLDYIPVEERFASGRSTTITQ
ncbi:MAG: DUF917 domain-containing protein [Pseudonocardiaceae bacterium]